MLIPWKVHVPRWNEKLRCMALDILERIIIKETCLLKKNKHTQWVVFFRMQLLHVFMCLIFRIVFGKSLVSCLSIPSSLAQIWFIHPNSFPNGLWTPQLFDVVLSWLWESWSYDARLPWQWICTNRWLRVGGMLNVEKHISM